MVTCQSQIGHRSGKVRRPETVFLTIEPRHQPQSIAALYFIWFIKHVYWVVYTVAYLRVWIGWRCLSPFWCDAKDFERAPFAAWVWHPGHLPCTIWFSWQDSKSL